MQGINVPGDGNHVGNGLDVGGRADIDLARMGGLVAGSPGAAERDGVSGTGEGNDGRGNLEDESHFGGKVVGVVGEGLCLLGLVVVCL